MMFFGQIQNFSNCWVYMTSYIPVTSCTLYEHVITNRNYVIKFYRNLLVPLPYNTMSLLIEETTTTKQYVEKPSADMDLGPSPFRQNKGGGVLGISQMTSFGIRSAPQARQNVAIWERFLKTPKVQKCPPPAARQKIHQIMGSTQLPISWKQGGVPGPYRLIVCNKH